MKKIITYIFCCITLLSATLSCTNNKKKNQAASGTSSSTDIAGPADSASRVIEYTNLVVDMANSHNSYLKDILGNASRIEKGLKNPADKFAFIGIITPHVMRAGLTNMNGVTLEKPVDELGKENQAYFKTQITQYNTLFTKLQHNYKQLDDYLKAEDYKDDKGAKGYAFIDTIRKTVQVLYTDKIVLMKKVNEVADAAEIVVLKDSPLKEYIVAMKTDMKNIRSFVDLLADNGKNYPKISNQVQESYKSLEAAQAKNAGLNIDNAKKANKDGQYKRFYEGFHDLLLRTKKTLRDATAAGKLTDNDIEGLDRDYDGLIRNYNYFNQ
ncbi:hypothetical protein HDE68_004367 [Pedobacter cryoconitis]|uniref:DUF3829 domain-containing protein n=1 Tax=Pedobacter cryoconitis TaxID=188932 RepID=A0A7W9E0Y2_9SPHI|nr:hypothetical protein [Pedobacter cryoconitis]MBB5638438.1 hypothetical protein [Pedobacter cryoconitis]